MRDSNRGMMYDAVCDECGVDCQVPFSPSGVKPVYCSRCYEKMNGGGNSRRNDRGGRRDYGRGRDRGGRRDNDRKMYDIVCDDCGKHDSVPFRPSNDKPIYCSDCFDLHKDDNKGGSKVDLTEVNEKLDRILELLESK